MISRVTREGTSEIKPQLLANHMVYADSMLSRFERFRTWAQDSPWKSAEREDFHGRSEKMPRGGAVKYYGFDPSR